MPNVQLAGALIVFLASSSTAMAQSPGEQGLIKSPDELKRILEPDIRDAPLRRPQMVNKSEPIRNAMIEAAGASPLHFGLKCRAGAAPCPDDIRKEFASLNLQSTSIETFGENTLHLSVPTEGVGANVWDVVIQLKDGVVTDVEMRKSLRVF